MIDKGDEHLPLLNRLKEYRSRLGVNQTEMGKLAGVSRQTISQIERGDYSPSITLPLKKFFNTSGMIYKQMNLKDKLKEMTEDDQLKLLATDGMLVKRPLVIGDNFVLTGFKEKEWEEKLL